jgi:hypothetical protein
VLAGPAAAARTELEARLHVPVAVEAVPGLDRETFELA